MKSIIKALRCPCGCDVPVNPLLERIYTHLKFNYLFKVTKGVACEDYPETTLANTIELRVYGHRTAQELVTSLTACLKKRVKNYKIIVWDNKNITIVMGGVGQVVEYGEPDANIQHTS